MTKTQLEKLYCYHRLSMTEVSRKLRTTPATVLYWLKKHDIPRRSRSESAYVKLNPSGDPFKIPTVLTEKQRQLLAAGLLLYWAEGAKTNRAGAKIGNLDGRMLLVFMRFLREVCHVDERRLSVYVRTHKRFSLVAARHYWGRLLTLPASRVCVYPHTDKRSQAQRQWSRHGLATLEFHNTKFKAWLDQAIEECVSSLVVRQHRSKLPQVIRRSGEGLLADGTTELAHHSVSMDEGRCAWNEPSWVTRDVPNN